MTFDQKKNIIINDTGAFLSFFKVKNPVYHNSNVFFRDIQYNILYYFINKEIKATYEEAEAVAKEFIKKLESEGKLVQISRNAWKLNYPEFVTLAKSA
ncbi:MAG: hypothetical protein HUU54_05980 [Ignavibacteriaceae bacterium]|nr:hypothetical protein [Ignavibacteriaceae bacterium]